MSAPTDSLPLERALAGYLDHERLEGRSPATLRARRNAILQFGKVWGDRDLREVEMSDLDAYGGSLTGRVSKATAYLYLASLRAFFRHLAQRQLILVDPAMHLRLPRMRSRPLGKVLTTSQMQRLLETQVNLRDRALVELLYSTGLRISEARRLRLEDLGGDAVRVQAGKGSKDRKVPLGKLALGWIRRYVDEERPKTDAPELFLNEGGRGFGEAHFRVRIRDLGRRAGLEGVTCHVIRRSMATHLLAAGANPKEVSSILGHEDLRSLARYVVSADLEVKETHRRTHPRETV
jgi:site-specific recombinase XerD